jgi:glutaredoxin
MMRKSGQMAVPVIDIDGKITVGFDEEDLNKQLAA